jgi:hypothetical protein
MNVEVRGNLESTVSPSPKDEQCDVKLKKGDGVEPQEWGLGMAVMKPEVVTSWRRRREIQW